MKAFIYGVVYFATLGVISLFISPPEHSEHIDDEDF